MSQVSPKYKITEEWMLYFGKYQTFSLSFMEWCISNRILTPGSLPTWLSFCQTLSWLQKKKGENLLVLSVQYYPHHCWWCSFGKTDGARNWKFVIFPGTRARTTLLLGTQREPCCSGRAAVGMSCASPGESQALLLQTAETCWENLDCTQHRERDTRPGEPQRSPKTQLKQSSWVETAERSWAQ